MECQETLLMELMILINGISETWQAIKNPLPWGRCDLGLQKAF